MRALSADAPSIRGTGLKAGVLMVRGPGSSKAVELMAVFDALLDKADLPAHFEYGILSLYGELGRNLGSAPLDKLLNRLDGQLSSESESVGKGAARGLAAALGGALDSGMVELEDVQQRAQAGLDTAAAANTAAEARAAAFRIGAACAAAGAELLQEWGVVTKLFELLSGESAATENSREAALLAIDQLCLRLGKRFEPYLLPQLEARVIAMYADKERKVVDAAAKVVKTLVTGLNPLAVKLVLPALYRGMEGACAWRTKEACIQALGLLAQHAKVETGPCLQVRRPHGTPSSRSHQTLRTRSQPPSPRAPAPPHRRTAACRTVHGARPCSKLASCGLLGDPPPPARLIGKEEQHPGTPRHPAGASTARTGPMPPPRRPPHTRMRCSLSSPAPRLRANPRQRPPHRAIHRRHAASGRLRSK